MNTVTLIPNALEPEHRERFDVPELLPWLVERFGARFAPNARIYHQVGVAQCDVTPETVADIEHLAKLRGSFVVRVYPAGLSSGQKGALALGILTLGGTFLVGAVAAGVAMLLPGVPNIKTPAQRARQLGAGSPNNQLGRRSNTARPEERIPDIFGQVKSIPDLLTVPYTSYVNHVEQETAYYCVGRGFHVVDQLRDGDTLIEQIQGATVEVYDPGKAPTGGIALHEPSQTIGDPIEDDVYNVYAVESVNGQTLFSLDTDMTFYGSTASANPNVTPLPNAEALGYAPPLVDDLERGVRNAVFEYLGGDSGTIDLPFNASSDEITSRLSVGAQLRVIWPLQYLVTAAGKPDLITPVTSTSPEPVECESLTVTSIVASGFSKVRVFVQIPPAQQAQWALLAAYFPGDAYNPYARVQIIDQLYAGPFFIDFQHPPGSSGFEVVCNFVAPNGLMADDGTTTIPLTARMQVILTPCDASGTPSGASEQFAESLDGSSLRAGVRALTMRCRPTGFGTNTRCLVRARRVSSTMRRWRTSDSNEFYEYGGTTGPNGVPAYYSGNSQEEVRWTHCYSMSKPPQTSFGNITTIHARTVATPGALRVKNRELSCIASRKIRTWNGTTFDFPVSFNDAAENVLFEVMKDTAIGNLPDASIDFEGIVSAFAAVRASLSTTFNTATQFAYTFDDADVSFEETMMAICQSAFCTPFRRNGNVLSARPEVATDDSVLILGHRNVLKDSMKITHSFGPSTEHDSVEVGFHDPFDDTITKVIVPEDSPQRAPKQIGVIGLRTERQAYWHAYRAYHKMTYQRQSVAMQVTQEAGILGVRERVLIADQTRVGTQDGEIRGHSGTSVRTSQPVALEGGRTYTLYLQDPDGSVQSVGVASSPGEYLLTLSTVPSPAPITDMGLGVRTLYQLIADDEATPRAYLIASTQPGGHLTHDVAAVNYSHMYYLADGLTTWVQFSQGLDDLSPFQRELTGSLGSIGGGVWTGSFGDYFEVTGALPADIDGTTTDYTCFLRINAVLPTDAGLIQSGNDTSTLFSITAGGLLVAGHDGTLVLAFDYNAFLGEEHTVALSYVAATERMAMFVDGVLVDETTRAQSAMTGIYRYLGDYEGTCRELYKWSRALSDREIMEVHLRTRP